MRHVRTGLCQTCGRTVRWARTDRGRAMPLEMEPDLAGNQATMLDQHGVLVCRAVTAERPLYPYEKPAMPHFAVCPGAPAAPEPITLPANVIQFPRRRAGRR